MDAALDAGAGELGGGGVVPPEVGRVDGDADLVGQEAFREVQGLGECGDHAAVGGVHGVEGFDGQADSAVGGVGGEFGEGVRDAFAGGVQVLGAGREAAIRTVLRVTTFPSYAVRAPRTPTRPALTS